MGSIAVTILLVAVGVARALVCDMRGHGLGRYAHAHSQKNVFRKHYFGVGAAESENIILGVGGAEPENILGLWV